MLPKVGNQVMMFLFSRSLTFGMGSAAENMVCLFSEGHAYELRNWSHFCKIIHIIHTCIKD